MSNEEIIIDGVNVTECVFYGSDECDLGYMQYNSTYKTKEGYPKKCKDNSICYFKKLQHLKEKYDTLTNKFFNSETDKTHLKQENEELKKSLKTWQYSDQQHLIKIVEYEKTLEEIKQTLLKNNSDCIPEYIFKIIEKINQVL